MLLQIDSPTNYRMGTKLVCLCREGEEKEKGGGRGRRERDEVHREINGIEGRKA